MQSDNNRWVQVVKRDEKEARLTQFILEEIASGRVSLSGEWRVLALTLESPVLAAIERVLADLGCASNLKLSIVLATSAKKVDQRRFEGAGKVVYRSAGCTRLLDAHEQMVLGAHSSWTGDCMRRNPRERDAFETFGSNNSELADWAKKSFDRIWQNAVPLQHGASGQSGNSELINSVLSSGNGLPKTSVLASTGN